MTASLEACCLAITFSAAVLIYLNTLPAGFAFDDNFAVVGVASILAWWLCAAEPLHGAPQIYNGDVTNNGNPLYGLFVHDFWCGSAHGGSCGGWGLR